MSLRGPIARRPFVISALLLALAILAGGCGRTGTTAAKEWQGHALKVTVWSGPFIDHFQETIVGPFEEMTGATEYTIARENGLLIPLRMENIPNAQFIWEPVKRQVPLIDGLGVPFDYGENVLVFLPEKLEALGTELKAWKDLFRPELKGRSPCPAPTGSITCGPPR